MDPILHKLEFYKIIENLAQLCTSSLGKEKAQELRPSTKGWHIKDGLAETTEAKETLRLRPSVPLAGLQDIRSALKKAQIGGLLEPEELLRVSSTLRASRKMRTFLTTEEKEERPIPMLKALAEGLGNYRNIEEEINRCIIGEGEIADNASAELQRIRKTIKTFQTRVREKLEAIIRSPEKQKYLQEALVTVRGDRYVVPVRQEYRNQIPGLIHDQSASGATVFIEPMAVVELNNDLKRYHAAEKTEILRILQSLSVLVGQESEDIAVSTEILSRLDFIFAKARLSQKMDGGEPAINQRGQLTIRSGRHPLITGKVVPVSIELGKKFRTLVITGPNTGGKTVTLKTVGLLTLMAQAGLHVPAEPGTELAIFEQIFVDIGDEQSIEQSLSTFSSHMTNLVQILEKTDSSSLVLLDELGAGTDPTEGAALAQAILEYLHQKGAKTIATTHYSELKTFAYTSEEIENASVEFDIETLSPTYRLLIGRPGRSNAFEISGRLGLSHNIIDRARSLLTQDERNVANLIEHLEANQVEAQKEREEAMRLRQEAEELRRKLDQREKAWREKEDKILIKARDEAYRIVKEAKDESERIVKDLRLAMKRLPIKEELLKAEQERNKLRQMQDTITGQRLNKEERAHNGLKTVKIGQTVRVPRLNQKGSVLTLPNNQGDLQIQAGILKLTVNIKELEATEEEKEEKGRTSYAVMAGDKAREISRELDFRGTTVDEAMEQVAKYLDDAYLTGTSPVYLIHGKGTGALRSAIRSYLKNHHYIKSFRNGEQGEGGLGVTVVEMKS
ncbi:endonuclease MutS2 [Heliorestis acidaminivorans]|uniref:Endonuclease MutS2 n=1 Tax=Heliorestis acidaminivorans TaxID=553427 RepID=A0A6I0EQH9_9FIRM|nr:endonuclease MutS2 [Heliorestis acidaminivorans]KAB2951590.1 endonuclease MutS2 [Heliorestis acidaminivorans]